MQIGTLCHVLFERRYRTCCRLLRAVVDRFNLEPRPLVAGNQVVDDIEPAEDSMNDCPDDTFVSRPGDDDS